MLIGGLIGCMTHPPTWRLIQCFPKILSNQQTTAVARVLGEMTEGLEVILRARLEVATGGVVTGASKKVLHGICWCILVTFFLRVCPGGAGVC